MAAHGSLDNVQTKLVVIEQKLVRESARWSRLMCDQCSRRARWPPIRKLASRVSRMQRLRWCASWPRPSGENSSAEELGSRCCGDGVRTLRSNEVRDYKLTDECITMSSECEERQRFWVEEVVNSPEEVVTLSRLVWCQVAHLELFNEAVKAHSQDQVQNSIATKSPGSGTVTRLRSRSSMTQMRRNRSRRHVTKRECNWKRERRGKRVTRKIKKPVINVEP